jgi:hypothetical protein
MRLLLGMILGALLTVLAAYSYDNIDGRASGGRTMVNWDVVRDNWHEVQANLRDVGNRMRDEWVKRSG